jgi:peptidoglycan/LPS O-acetylase OafA/YrhL
MQKLDQSTGRLESLDGLRGVAALVVVFTHALLSQPVFWDHVTGVAPNTIISWLIGYTPLRLLWAGDKAVILFFILSGFVLTIPWTTGRNRAYPIFLLSRICRIYLPYCVAMLIGAVLATKLGGHLIPGASGWINMYGWAGQVNEDTLPSVLLVLQNSYSTWLNNATWSLVWEMRVSVIFPLLVIPVVRWGWMGTIAVSVFLWAAFGLGQAVDSVNPVMSAYIGDPHKIFFYATYFLVGSIMARYRGILTKLGSVQNGAVATSLFLAGMAYWLIHWPTNELLNIPGGILVIIAAISTGPINRFLNKPVTQWLGQVSYSLYLVHVPIIMSLNYWLSPSISHAKIAILSIFLSLMVAEVFYRIIEQPSHNLGRFLTRRNWHKPSLHPDS